MQNQLIKHNIKHVMADGIEFDRIEGFIVPLNVATLPVYNLLADYARKAANKKLEQSA